MTACGGNQARSVPRSHEDAKFAIASSVSIPTSAGLPELESRCILKRHLWLSHSLYFTRLCCTLAVCTLHFEFLVTEHTDVANIYVCMVGCWGCESGVTPTGKSFRFVCSRERARRSCVGGRVKDPSVAKAKSRQMFLLRPSVPPSVRPSCAAVARWCPVGCPCGVAVSRRVSCLPHNLLITRRVVV